MRVGLRTRWTFPSWPLPVGLFQLGVSQLDVSQLDAVQLDEPNPNLSIILFSPHPRRIGQADDLPSVISGPHGDNNSQGRLLFLVTGHFNIAMLNLLYIKEKMLPNVRKYYYWKK